MRNTSLIDVNTVPPPLTSLPPSLLSHQVVIIHAPGGVVSPGDDGPGVVVFYLGDVGPHVSVKLQKGEGREGRKKGRREGVDE